MRPRALAVLPWGLLVLVSAALLALGVQHHDLRLSFLEHRRGDAHAQRGDYVPAFAGLNAADSFPVGAPGAGGHEVLVFLTTTCPFCQQTLPAWNEIAERLSGNPRVRIAALTTDSASAVSVFVRNKHLRFPVFTFPSRRLAALYHAFRVPQTIVVDSAGRVVYARAGAITTSETIDSVLAAALPSDSTVPDTSQ